MASTTFKNCLKAAVFAGTLGLLGQTALAAPDGIYIDVRKGPMQLDGDVIDLNVKSGAMSGTPTGGVSDKALIDDFGGIDGTDPGEVDCEDPGSPLDVFVAPISPKVMEWTGNTIGATPPLDSCGTVAGPSAANSDTDDGHTGGNSVNSVHIIDVDQHNWDVQAGTGTGNPLDDVFTGTRAVEDICEWKGVFSSANRKTDIMRASGAVHEVLNTDPNTDDGASNPTGLFSSPGGLAPRTETFLTFQTHVLGFNGDNSTGFWYLTKDIETVILPSPVAGTDFIFREPGFDANNFDCEAVGDPNNFGGFCTAVDPCNDPLDPDFQLHDDGDLLVEIDFLGGGGDPQPRAFLWDTTADGGNGDPVEIIGPGSTGTTKSSCLDVLTAPGDGDPRLCAASNADGDETLQAKDRPLDTKSIATWLVQHPSAGGNEPPSGNGELEIGEPTLANCNYPSQWPDDDMDCRTTAGAIQPWWHRGATLYEGQINLSSFFDPVPCFSTFIGFTVPTQSTGEKKDLAIGGLPICGTIKVIKQTIPDGAAGDFEFDAESGPLDGVGFLTDDLGTTVDGLLLSDDQMFQVIDLLPGQYTAAEVNLPVNFDLTDITCAENKLQNTTHDVNTGEADIQLEVAEDVVCTFTNSQKGKIIIRKEYSGPTDFDGENKTFDYTSGQLGGGAFALTAAVNTFPAADCNPDTADCVIFDNLTPGAYDVVETLPTAPASFDGLTCSDPTGGTSIDLPNRRADIDLAPGETVICTFENIRVRQPGKIIIEKVTIGGDDNFTYDNTSPPAGIGLPPQFSLLTVANFKSTAPLFDVDPGEYTVTEQVLPGWDLTNLVCVDPINGAGGTVEDLGNRKATITIDDGETVTCTFTNTQRAQIKIIKNVIGDDGTFTYTHVVAGLDTSLTTSGGMDMDTSDLIMPGAYSVVEDDPTPDYDLTALSCVDPDAGTTTDLGTRTASIDLDPGELVTCTFTNTQRGQLKLIKVSTGNGAEFDFSSNVPGLVSTLTTAAGTNQTAEDLSDLLVPGNGYEVAEIPEIGWSLAAKECKLEGGANTGTAAGDGFTGIEVEPGKLTTCTFTNVQRGMVDVLKTVSGLLPGGLIFDFEIRVGADLVSSGTTLATGSSDPVTGEAFFLCTADGVASGLCDNLVIAPDPLMAKLVPGDYQFCEVGMMPGWMNDIAGFTPNGETPEGGDNSSECIDFTLDPGETESFMVDNTPPPGGDARTIGFWKNWTSCDGHGNQDFVLDDTLEAPLFPAFVPIDIGVLMLDGTEDCEVAVDLLDKRAVKDPLLVGDGKKRASDAAYALASQLLAANLNFAAGAGTCPAATLAANNGQSLLLSIGFDGGQDGTPPNSDRFLPPNSNGPAAVDRVDALMYAATLDDYNNNELCPAGP